MFDITLWPYVKYQIRYSGLNGNSAVKIEGEGVSGFIFTL